MSIVTNIEDVLNRVNEDTVSELYENIFSIKLNNISVEKVLDIYWLMDKKCATSNGKISVPRYKDSLSQFCKQIRKDLRNANRNITNEVTIVGVSTKLSKNISPIDGMITPAKNSVTTFVCDRDTKNLYFATIIAE